METILEEQRRLHEERERLIEIQVKEILRKKTTNREQINSDHLVKLLWDKYIESSTNLINLYEDRDGLRKKEIQSLSGPNDYNEFSNRLKSIVQYHKKTPLTETAIISVPISVEYDNLVKMIQSNDDEAGLYLFVDFVLNSFDIDVSK